MVQECREEKTSKERKMYSEIRQKSSNFDFPLPSFNSGFICCLPSSASAPHKGPACLQNFLPLKRLGWGLLCSWFSVNLTLKQSWKKLGSPAGNCWKIGKKDQRRHCKWSPPISPTISPVPSTSLKKTKIDFLNDSQYWLLYLSE